MKNVFSMYLFLLIVEGVFGVDPDKVKTVIEGDSVTLQTDFTEMQKDGLIEWIVNGTNIAKIDKGTGKVKYNELKVMFSDRLNLDQTGFLTIWNIRIKHSGEYKLGSISSAGIKSNMFKVIVKESPLKSVEDKYETKALSAMKGSSETLHTETELQKHDLILWRFGAEGSLIAKCDTEDNQTLYYDGDDGRFRSRLELDSKTGSLTITDLKTEHAGEFRLKIISDRRIVFKRFVVTVSVPGLSAGVIAGICVVVVLLLVAAAVTSGVVIYFRHKVSELKKLIPKISERLEQLPKISKDLEQLLKLFKQLSEICEKKESPGENEMVKISEKLKKMSNVCEKELPKISEHLEQLHQENISERLCEISDKLKEMFEGKKPEQQEQLHEPETSQQETCADVPQEETPRSEIRDGVRERFIVVEETAISKAFGAGKILRDSRGRKSIPIRAEDEEVHTHDDVKISEQETRADVTQEETPRSEIREGEREQIIYVEETAISKVLGADKRLKDRQGKKNIVIRKANTEDTGVQTHGSDEKVPENELKEESTGKEVNEETPFMSQKEEDGSNE